MTAAHARPLTLPTANAISAATATAITDATAAVITSGAAMPVRQSTEDFQLGQGFRNPLSPLAAWGKGGSESPVRRRGPFSPGSDAGSTGGLQ